MEKINLLCVYDLLKRNCSRNHLLRSAEYVGEFYSEPIYDLYYDVNNNNVRLLDGSNIINFEVYEINDKIIKTLNFVYSANKQSETRIHSLNVIKTPYGNALTYYNNIKLKSNEVFNILEDYEIKLFFNKNIKKYETIKI